MSQNTEVEQHKHHGYQKPGFWITFIRAILAIALGLILIFSPEKTSATLFNFMGMFWLMSGIAIYRQQIRPNGSRLLLAAGVSGILAGLLVITRDFSRNYLAETLVVIILGTIIVLTGILHIAGGIRVGKQASRGRTTFSVIWGIFEIILGGILIFSGGNKSPVLYWTATLWALFAGIFLFLDSIRQYRAGELES
jgi:uncharacterized membrane protein HdeD (DUF308 family)